ncbi:MAG: hypothetical protein AAGC55_11580, partial [Myxococcota bacterium]
MTTTDSDPARPEATEATEPTGRFSSTPDSAAHAAAEPARRASVAYAVILPMAVVAGAVAGGWWLLDTAPEQTTSPSAPAQPVVEVMAVEPGSAAVAVVGYGVVSPAREAALSPEVAGRIIKMHPTLEPGGLVRARDALITIDAADYRLAVQRAEAQLARAQAELD